MKVLFCITIILACVIAGLVAYILTHRKPAKLEADGTLSLEAAGDGGLAWRMNIINDITAKDQIVLDLSFDVDEIPSS